MQTEGKQCAVQNSRAERWASARHCGVRHGAGWLRPASCDPTEVIWAVEVRGPLMGLRLLRHLAGLEARARAWNAMVAGACTSADHLERGERGSGGGAMCASGISFRVCLQLKSDVNCHWNDHHRHRALETRRGGGTRRALRDARRRRC